MSVTVWTRVALPGFHHWPGAPATRDYLAHRHRHLFVITVHAEVDHDDRHVEFHDLQDLIRAWWGPTPRECGSASCEQLAAELWTYLAGQHDVTLARIDVSEDGESGATLTKGGTA